MKKKKQLSNTSLVAPSMPIANSIRGASNVLTVDLPSQQVGNSPQAEMTGWVSHYTSILFGHPDIQVKCTF